MTAAREIKNYRSGLSSRWRDASSCSTLSNMATPAMPIIDPVLQSEWCFIFIILFPIVELYYFT